MTVMEEPRAIPAEAVAAAVGARKALELARRREARRLVNVTSEGDYVFTDGDAPTEEELAYIALEAAAPHIIAGYFRGINSRAIECEVDNPITFKGQQ